jgi:hypothetical protein
MNHDELKELYRLDELLHPEGKPWEWWDRKATFNWVSMFQEPSWYEDVQYHRKPTAPNWDEELSPREVAECDELPIGYEVAGDDGYVAILFCGAEIWNQDYGWLYEQKADNDILNHFKKRREQALATYGNTRDNPLSKRQQQAAEDIASTDPKEQSAQQKAQHCLLPPLFLKQVTAVLEHGAEKYGPYNWRESDGIQQDVYISATFRHLIAIMEGQRLDPDSGQPHWAHIAATSAIMIDAYKHGKLKR